MPTLNCANDVLETYVPSSQNPWNQKKALHLFRRLYLGGDVDKVNTALNGNPVDLVNQIITDAINLPLVDEPEWAYWSIDDYSPIEAERNQQIIDQILQWGRQWMIDLKANGLRDRMSWYWHNHFVTRLESYFCPSWMYQYHKILQEYALGNFREFTREMCKTPAMLVFLDGVQNTQFDPNENLAREIYEIFTLGVDNGYTQDDIVNTARALTGWNGIDVNNLCDEITFVPAFHDNGSKTIFGQTGNWGYDDVIDILFEQRGLQICKHICGKIYRDFVNPIDKPEIIDVLAQTMLDNDFELEPVFRQLFTSGHFFDESHVGTIIPGHIEYFMTFLGDIGYPDDDELLFAIGFSADDFDQRIFNPTDVSGWPGNRNWITSSTLQYRWQSITDIMGYYYGVQGETLEPLRDFAIKLSSNTEIDPAVVVRNIIDYILPNGLQFDQEYEEAITVFKGEVPQNYFDEGIWNLDWEYAPVQVFLLLSHLARVPEFQLK